jgi:hypothetical protein
MKNVLFAALISVVVTTTSWAQAAPARPATPAQPAQPVSPAQPGTAASSAGQYQQNVRFDVTITETGGPKPVTKTVSLTVSPGANGSIRSTAYAPGDPAAAPPPVSAQASPVSWLNVDVRISGLVDNGVRASVNIEYQPYLVDSKVKLGAITAGSMSVFYDGRRTQLLVASDPISDRRTTIEVLATVLK